MSKACKKKIAVIKLGLPLNYEEGGIVGAIGEAFSIMQLLSQNYEVHYFTLNSAIKNKQHPIFAKPHSIEHEIPSSLNYEYLVVINGLPDVYKNELDRYNYEAIKSFGGGIIYFYCDPRLPLINFRKTYYFDISEKPILVIHQPWNISPFKHFYSEFKLIKFVHYPLYLFPLAVFRRLPLEYSLNQKTVDLGYGGSLRKGKRLQQIVDWFFNIEELSVEIFGKMSKEEFIKYGITEDKYKFPKIGKPVDYYGFILKMQKFYATINLGDQEYYGNNLNQRIYENILANTASFIDSKYDTYKKAFINYNSLDSNDKKIIDFLYVENKNELIKKIKKIKENSDLYEHLLNVQYEAVKINPRDYAFDLYWLIETSI